MILASIPSPPSGVWHLGPIPIRGYALCIIAGIIVAVFITERRLRDRGWRHGLAADVATWAVPFGLVGARLYNVVTDPELYWGSKGQGTLATLEIWHGGLGIWGGVAGGCLGAYIAGRRAGVPFWLLADAAAPGLAVAQAIGRWGNYFNQELYGRPSGLPWAVHIDPAHRPTIPSGPSAGLPDPHFAHIATYQPTFLYESLWDLGAAVLLVWVGRRWQLTNGRVFALYVMLYTVGRSWIEALRIDYAHRFFGLRLNDWTSLVCFVGGLIFFVVRRNRAGPEPPAAAVPDADAGAGDPTAQDPARTLQQ